MSNTDEAPQGLPPQPGRRPATTRFQDSRFSSPSTTYNYNSNAGYNQGNGFGSQQHPRRRIDRFKRESINYNDRMIRQNDSIIRLLKEIRDRLPAPPASAAVVANEQDQIALDGVANPSVQEAGKLSDDGQEFDQDARNFQEPDGKMENQPE
jgi:hypothetical protein